MSDDALVDYARRDYEYRRHYSRFERYVESHGFPCQECRGMGGWIEPILDYGQGPFYSCGYCEGTGKVTRWTRGQWLRWKREEKRPWMAGKRGKRAKPQAAMAEEERG